MIGLRPVERDDEPMLTEIFERRADYFEAATGSPPGPADAVVDFPTSGIASIGLFILDPSSALRGRAIDVVDLAVAAATVEGMTEIRTGCPAGWASGERLLVAAGFAPWVGAPAIPNRVVHPAEALRDIRRWSRPLH